jgi:large repetitive protein
MPFEASSASIEAAGPLARLAKSCLTFACVATVWLALAGAASAAACDTSWKPSAGSGSWATATNWTGGVPTAMTNACITAPGSYTVNVSGAAAAESLTLGSSSGSSGPTLDLAAGASTNATLTLGDDSVIEQTGTLVLDAGSGGGSANLTGPANAILTNDGTVDAQVEGAGLNFLELPLTNDGNVTVASGELRQDDNTTTSNSGSVTVDSNAQYNMTTGSDQFANETGGTVTNNGAITLSNGASWTSDGGGETGSAVTMFAGTFTDIGSAPSGSFDMTDNPTLDGQIAPGETIELTGLPGHNATASLNSRTLTNAGTIVLDSQSNGGYADLSDGTLDNNGTLRTQVETGGNLDLLEVGLVNQGTVTVQSGELRQDNNTTTANKGSMGVDSGAQYTLTTASDQFDNDTGGSITNDGAIMLSNGASWSSAGGGGTGGPVSIFGGTFTDTGTAPSGSFDLVDSTTITGTIASGETIDVAAPVGHNASADLGGDTLTNHGTIVLDSQSGGGYADLLDGVLDNDGSLRAQVEGSQLNYLEATLVNDGTVTVASGELRQDDNTATTNNGDVTVDAGAAFSLYTSDDVFTQSSSGTLTFGIASASSIGTLEIDNGATFHLNGGTADPVLVGSYAPPVGTEFDVIMGTWGAGAFTTVANSFSGDYSHTGYVGVVRTRVATTTTVSSSANPSGVGQPVTFTATVTPGPNGPATPTGTVTFYDGGSSIGTGPASTTQGVTTATLTTSSLSLGIHAVTASYGGDSNYVASGPSSPALQQDVRSATTTTLKSSPNPSKDGQSVTFTATVRPANSGAAPPSGSVTFYSGTSSIGTGSMSTGGGVTTARLTTSALHVGTHAITASYGGDSNYAPSMTNAALNQVVAALPHPTGCSIISARGTKLTVGRRPVSIDNKLYSRVSGKQTLVLTAKKRYFELKGIQRATCLDDRSDPLSHGHKYNELSVKGTGSYGSAARHAKPHYAIAIAITVRVSKPARVTFTIASSGGKAKWKVSGTLTHGSEHESG